MTLLQITTCEDVFSGPTRFLPGPLGAVCAGVGGGGEEGVCCTYKQVEMDQDNNDDKLTNRLKRIRTIMMTMQELHRMDVLP